MGSMLSLELLFFGLILGALCYYYVVSSKEWARNQEFGCLLLAPGLLFFLFCYLSVLDLSFFLFSSPFVFSDQSIN